MILLDSSLEVSADFTSAFNVTLNEKGLFVFAFAYTGTTLLPSAETKAYQMKFH